MKKRGNPVFNTNKRIKVGLWGLGRGMNFYEACAALNMDVVAGCDYNAHMRKRFLESNPGAFATDDAAAFLAADFDAVVLATFCPAHADDAIRCLQAGKHVLSEVTAFHTMAEGVRLVEAVEASGLVYNLAENYPFTAEQMFVARKWKEGLFGDLMYAEGEYVHEIRSLAHTYIDGKPIEPGDRLHSWRSWLDFHYYCTHSLGPIMHITGARPTRVVSLPGLNGLSGTLPNRHLGMGTVAPSLITMSNGAVARNLMGAMTNDTHVFRYWGTNGSAEIGDGLSLRLGSSGGSPKLKVDADWGELTPLAEKMGHGGGDFFVLYYFARQLLFGETAPFDIYSAADVTIPGILAYRSAQENGKAYDVPDFRHKAERRKWRNDNQACPRYDVEHGCFPKRADKRLTRGFNTIMKDLFHHTAVYRAYADWSRVSESVKEQKQLVEVADALIEAYPGMRRNLRKARRLADAYPRSDGARMLRAMLEQHDEAVVMRRGFLDGVKKQRATLKRRMGRAAKR